MTEKDKYAIVISNLLFKVVHRIPRTLATEDKPYTVLKVLVKRETNLSDYHRSEKLHALPALGDQCPSELLTLIRNLAGRVRIDCYGSRMIPLQFSRRRFTRDFEVAEVKKPILGADFLTAHGLMVDLQRGCLTSNDEQQLVLPCDLHVLSSNSNFSINRIHCLLEQFVHCRGA